ncbi:MAG TPA: Pvc16 family protein, partial [Pyrinomonadaceae bacterium]|nr:Pvc16 family protein [Pyrinomonadaceae bacterium]
MSTALAIAAVTAVLKDLLNNGLIDHNVSAHANLGEVSVSALPPDRVLPDPSKEQNQLNLFLYQVTQNAGWRNVALPARSGRGDRLT